MRGGSRRGEPPARRDTPPFGWAFGVMRRAPTPQPRRYTSTVAETQHMRTECMRVCMVPNQSPWLDGRVNMESLARFMDIPAAHGACKLSVCMAAATNHRHGVARDGRCKIPCDCSMATRWLIVKPRGLRGFTAPPTAPSGPRLLLLLPLPTRPAPRTRQRLWLAAVGTAALAMTAPPAFNGADPAAALQAGLMHG